MRKVKLLALLLAALMVVTAFAGCANTKEIESNVADLDERVSALEGKIDDVKDAIEDSNADEELKAIQDALKEQEEANKALLEQIKELTDKVTKVEQDDESADDDAALQAAVKVYTAKLNESKITYELERDDYTDADYATIVNTISEAIADISVAKTKAEVEKIYNDAKAVLDDKSTVLSKLVGYYKDLLNNITADSEDLVNEAYAFVAANGPVADVYGLTSKKVTEYKTGAIGADGAPVTVDLVAAINGMKAAHVYVSGTSFEKDVKAAKDLIAAIGTVSYNASGYPAVTTAQTKYDEFVNKISGNGVYAAYLSDSLVSLVDNSKLVAAKATISNLAVAVALYNADTFRAYKALTDKQAYANKAVYDATNATLAAWKSSNNLSDADVKGIVNAKEGGSKFYENYVYNNTVVSKYVTAYSKLSGIMDRIEALNGMTLLTTENIKEYASIAAAIDAWKALGKVKNADNTDVNVTINDATFATMLAESKKIPAGSGASYLTANAITKDAQYYGLYDFANAVKLKTEDFFGEDGIYLTAVAKAEKIKTVVKALNTLETDSSTSNNFNSVEQYILVAGEYEKKTKTVSGKTVECWESFYADGDETYTYNGSTVMTMAAFVAKYTADGSAGDGVSYSLEFLLDNVPFETGMKAVSDRLAKQAEAFKTLMYNADGKHLVDLIETNTVVNNGDGTFTKTTGKYYVNLDDKATVEAAQAAYDKWVLNGGNSNMRQWVANDDGTYSFTYIFDQDKLAKLDETNDRILKLNAMAKALVDHFTLMAEVIDVTFDNYKTVVASTGVMAESNKKTYILVAEQDKYEGANIFSVALAAKDLVVNANVETSAAKVADLMASGAIAYTEFMNANKESDDNATASKIKYATYAPVETALAGIFDLEFIYAQVAVYDIVSGLTTSDELDTYKNKWILVAENYVSLNNAYVEIYKKEGKDLAAVTYGANRTLVYEVNSTNFDATGLEK